VLGAIHLQSKFTIVDSRWYRRFSALFEPTAGETLALDCYAVDGELRLRGNNGELICAMVDGAFECVPP